jgi:cell division protein FtsZ
MDLTSLGLAATSGARRATERAPRDGIVAGRARLVVAGVGGGGTNAVNRMIEAEVRGVEYLALNTDAQALEQAKAEQRVQLGAKVTRGLGAGGNPAVGAKAAEESYAELRQVFSGTDLVFVTAGMGGGTGTGASPIVAQAAREQGALAVGIVTTPFGFERRRHDVADRGIQALREVVDALIVIPNERLMQLAARETGAFEAYRLADEVLRMGIQGISDLITVPGLINLDFADIRAVLADAGSAYLATSQASGENRAELAARGALVNPLLDGDITGARGLVFNVTGGDDLTMHEVGRIAEILSSAAHPDCNIIFGTVYDASCEGVLKLTVVATGFVARAGRDGQHQPWISARVAPGQGRTETVAIPDPARVPAAPTAPSALSTPSWPPVESHPTPPLPSLDTVYPAEHATGTANYPARDVASYETRPNAQPNSPLYAPPTTPPRLPALRGEAGLAPSDATGAGPANQSYYVAAYTPPPAGPYYDRDEAFAVGRTVDRYAAEHAPAERSRTFLGRIFGR